ncbi:MAG: hypothetical protein IT373_32890 [Polyangiaceae bacterium]|nr:hypothetical protein [Polyangiaceae bacterium]
MRLVARLLAALLALGASLGASAAHAGKPSAPARSVADVEHALAATHAELPPTTRHALATTLVEVARAHDFDAVLGWAIIEHESHWRADAVGRDGQDIGLAQIRYTSDAACQGGRESEPCRARRLALLDPTANIEAMGRAISAWKDLCTRLTGKAPDAAQILAGYGGYSRPSRQIYCGRQRSRSKAGSVWRDLPTPKAVREVVALRDGMLARLERERPARGKPTPGKPTPAKPGKPTPRAVGTSTERGPGKPTLRVSQQKPLARRAAP